MGHAHPKQISLTRKNAYGKQRVTITETDFPRSDLLEPSALSVMSDTLDFVPLGPSETNISFTASSTLRTFEFFEMSSASDVFSATSTVRSSEPLYNDHSLSDVDSLDDSGENITAIGI